MIDSRRSLSNLVARWEYNLKNLGEDVLKKMDVQMIREQVDSARQKLNESNVTVHDVSDFSRHIWLSQVFDYMYSFAQEYFESSGNNENQLLVPKMGFEVNVRDVGCIGFSDTLILEMFREGSEISNTLGTSGISKLRISGYLDSICGDIGMDHIQEIDFTGISCDEKFIFFYMNDDEKRRVERLFSTCPRGLELLKQLRSVEEVGHKIEGVKERHEKAIIEFEKRKKEAKKDWNRRKMQMKINVAETIERQRERHDKLDPRDQGKIEIYGPHLFRWKEDGCRSVLECIAMVICSIICCGVCIGPMFIHKEFYILAYFLLGGLGIFLIFVILYYGMFGTFRSGWLGKYVTSCYNALYCCITLGVLCGEIAAYVLYYKVYHHHYKFGWFHFLYIWVMFLELLLCCMCIFVGGIKAQRPSITYYWEEKEGEKPVLKQDYDNV